MTKTVLILGASGKVGSRAAQAFAQAGWHVRRHDRARGDMRADAQGADVIVNGLNPPKYHDWARLIPEITAKVIEAARASGASVIVPGNLYNLDDIGGEWSEHTPHRPTTRKGCIREAMEQQYRAAGVRTIVLRAGNFIDPGSSDDVMRLVTLRALAQGKITAVGDAKALQSYCYVPDWARAAVLISEMRDELETFEDIPFPGHAFSLETFVQFAERELQRPLKLVNFPWWLMRLSAPFWELAAEMLELRYLWSLSHSLSGAKLEKLLPEFQATSRDEVMRQALHAALQPASAELISQARAG